MPSSNSILTYLAKIRNVALAPSATEQTYRPALKNLIYQLSVSLNRPLGDVIIEPGFITEAGAPDFVIYNEPQELVGYVETKALAKNLENLSGQDAKQYSRYSAAFPIWIYTNFLEFRLIENGLVTRTVTLGTKAKLTGATGITSLSAQLVSDFDSLFDRFLAQSSPVVTDAKNLARLLAHKALLLKDATENLLTSTPTDLMLQTQLSMLQAQLTVYRNLLIPDLSEEGFADLLAQTLTYGLFLAAYENTQRNIPLDFNRANLLNLLPASATPVTALFRLVAAQLMPAVIVWFVEDIIRLLASSNLNVITNQFLQGNNDPTIHFYETFLSEYDPKLRQMRGVYYTPDAVVSYIIGSVDRLLRQYFGRSDGLADENVTLLDPALGTGTFLSQALRQVAANFGANNSGMVASHLQKHTLNNFFGFELLAAPYVLAHLKLAYTLSTLGLNNATSKIYLTNTLTEHQPQPALSPFEIALSQDAKAAQNIKMQKKILVIVGNPPYSGQSFNQYKAVNDYKKIDGVRINESNSKGLQNDYVKFIRWAEWKITEAEQAGYRHGIVGFITDHSYLEGKIYPGMRKHLLNNFSRIYILNLHGNSRFVENLPTGVASDKNVFDIQQGTAIVLLVREAGHSGMGQVFYADLWGSRQSKYDYLAANHVNSTNWTNFVPNAPDYYFVPRQLTPAAVDYNNWPSVISLLTSYSLGIATGRDNLTIHFDEPTAWNTVVDFANLPIEEARLKYNLGEDSQDWQVSLAQADLINSGMKRTKIKSILYRPFDTRYTYYTGKSKGFHNRPRNIMKQLLKPELRNLALITLRQTRKATQVRVAVSRTLTIAPLLSSEANSYVFPLYLFPDKMLTNGQTTIDTTNGTGRETTIPSGIITALSTQYQTEVTPESIFYYVYGILSAPGYQKEFQTLLQDDFPRIPFCEDVALFGEMSQKGERLAELFLLEASDLQGMSNLRLGYPIGGTDKVEKTYPKYEAANERVLINAAQYFSNVSEAMWTYQVGTYQPLKKWLEDRRERTLLADEIRHYQMTGTAISKIGDELNAVETAWQKVRAGGWFKP